MKEQQHKIEDGMVVTIDFTLTLDDGQVADTTQGDMPLRFLAGSGQLLPGLEDALMGLQVGDEREITLAPADGYGEWDEDALEEIERSEFPEDMELEEGLPIEITDSEGETYEASVHELRDDVVVLDYNHPLAGETLQFHVKILDIRPATKAELDHGHAHGGGEHHH